MKRVLSIASAEHEMIAGHEAKVLADEADRVRLRKGWIRVAGDFTDGRRPVVIFRNPVRQRAIKRYQDGKPVTVLEALYAESRLALG